MLPSHVILPLRYCSLSAPQLLGKKTCNLVVAANVAAKQGLFTSLESFELFWLDFPCLNVISCHTPSFPASVLFTLCCLQERPSLTNSFTASVCQPSGAPAIQISKTVCEPCQTDLCPWSLYWIKAVGVPLHVSTINLSKNAGSENHLLC